MRHLALLPIVMLSSVVPVAVAQPPGAPPTVSNTVFELPDGTRMTYGLSLPAAHAEAPDDPRPLVLALHPGGSAPYYGSNFMVRIVEPALRDWNAVIVAPDVPARRWSTERSEQAVLALLDDVMTRHAIDPTRVLVTGFSMGGRGTWYLATRHRDRFTGAIAIAASRGDDDRLEGLGSMPIHIIHSPVDEVVPFGPAEEVAAELAARRHPSALIRVEGAGHFDMGAYIEPLTEAAGWMRAQWDGR